MVLRSRLAQMLVESGLSQSELSRCSGVSFVTTNKIANDKSTRVDLAALGALSVALSGAIGRRVEVGELLEREAEPKKGRR